MTQRAFKDVRGAGGGVQRRPAGGRVHAEPGGAAGGDRDREEPRLGARRRRHAVARAAEAAVQGVLLPRQVVHVRVRLDRLQRARRRRARPRRQRALPALGAEPRRRDRLRRRSQPRRHEGRRGRARSASATTSCSSIAPCRRAIGSVFTTLYYMRRSYEEGLAAFGWAGERFAASTNYARMMYEGMRDHYGLEVENFKVHAYAEERPRQRRRLPAAPGGDHRRPAAPHPPRHRARAGLPQRAHRGAESLAGGAGRAARRSRRSGSKRTKRARLVVSAARRGDADDPT